MDSLRPSRAEEWTRSQRGFSLLEMVGGLAVLAILAAVLVASLVASADKAASDLETATLQSFGDALQRSILRYRIIPSENDWVTTVANEAGLSTSAVASNHRSRIRAFLIDTNGFNPLLLPYVQTNSGLAARPANPRVMIVSSIGAPLPGAVVNTPRPTTQDFTQLWNAAPGTVPTNSGSAWTGWNGKPSDVLVQRINLSSLFVNLLISSDQTNTLVSKGYYALDPNAATTPLLAPLYPGTNSAYLKNSVLALYIGTDNTSTTLDSQQILYMDTALYFSLNAWRSTPSYVNGGNTQTNAGLNSLWQNLASLADGFLSAGLYTNTIPTQMSLISDFEDYFSAYNSWADAGFPANTDPTYQNAVIQYNSMWRDVNTFLTPLLNSAKK